MILPDVNVLVYAHRRDAPDHAHHRRWLEDLLNGNEAFAFSVTILSSFVRVVTHPRIFKPPSSLQAALSFVRGILDAPNGVSADPGPRYWDIFESLCITANARGNLITDAMIAALAIENGCELMTTDRDFRRFPDLRWRNPTAKS